MNHVAKLTNIFTLSAFAITGIVGYLMTKWMGDDDQ